MNALLFFCANNLNRQTGKYSRWSKMMDGDKMSDGTIAY